MPSIKIQFLGAAGTVTGSKIYIETPQKNILIDCGMFQGIKELRKLNWTQLPIKASEIDIVLLTHGHLDHTGYLPRLIQQGFNGEIIGTAPTLAITEIILKDSAKINEEEADRANREGYSKHDPTLPFYTIKEVEKTVHHFKAREKDIWFSLSKDIEFRFRYNGHIIGACFIELHLFGKDFVFSGDIGRPKDLLLKPPEKPEWADFLFIESTYGNKLHQDQDIEEKLIGLIKETLYKQGTLIIPSFAVERLQTLMYLLWKLYQKNRIPNIPIYVDSPMGSNVLSVFEKFSDWHKLSKQDYNSLCDHINIVTSYKETWEVIDNLRPKIVIAGSGMVTGGRVLTYLKQLVDNTNTSILLAGYQAEGTRGRQLQDGVHEIKLYGKYYTVKAEIHHIESLSAHADQYELLDWVSKIKNIPEKVFLIHGEPSASEAFDTKLKHTLNWKTHIPKLHEVLNITV
ncbi:MBL fold metallo-hydrolase [Aquimarina sp. MMG015]|uniref:MBL fold metallo-hydrolase RNA specificity domain-containing protein n=1 Tax=Aquimarina sp. MMG015 TaxID=2822689 RepID=UPI001B3A746D|nr:MBL fold metallo-hydrolase [Aquimarina sp. MMG015]MBQ4802960.1 MBL fold metallo-hydrolase [Aquimarina sp. MMG015]